MNSEKLPLKTKLFYASGDIFGGGAFNIINFFYAIFLTDVIGLKMQYIAPILLIGKIWDAVTDPLMGFITDNTRTRFGRRRPYLLAGTFLVFISFFILWYPASFPNQLGKFIYALMAYIAFTTVFTMVMTPYTALGAELTLDYNERTSLNSYRLAFSIGAGLVCAVLPMLIVNAFSDIRTGYIVMAITFGLIFSTPWIGVFMFTKEREEFSKEKSTFNFFNMFFEPFKIKSFRLLIAMYLLAYLSIDVVSTIFAYYTKYYIGNEGLLPIALGALFITEIIFIPFYAFVAKKTSKNISYILGALVWCVAGFILFTFSPDVTMFQVILMAAIMGAGVSAVAVMPYTIFGDVTDVAELKFGKREEGTLSGLMTFVRKVASGLAVAGVTFSLGLAGFVNPIDGVEQPQPESFLFALRFIISFVPIILLVLGIIAAVRYPLNPKRHEKLREYLEAKRANKTIKEELEKEITELKKELI
ncbi:sugar transporter [Petrotoga sp. HKA.pet.4.5]|uniref:MFS transporter n=1 Tax=unclassified Petrotoga TaxID=2620614 RepID=UPI000EF16539|nr:MULTISPECIES: glycoside-pentoside-hexuronide (GPH):cation symporter [unclassified Petrotoga]RLL83967.1 sugar transporter [Petrotoga sp. Shatin.DS.tank11.9.2.9.3]RLL90409.1 sugar transporter [Petrotoga sp. HKA.pet.4.5]